jgi:hypothetical protein
VCGVSLLCGPVMMYCFIFGTADIPCVDVQASDKWTSGAAKDMQPLAYIS